MDDIVLAAMRKWPKVPHCYGWLGLDVRGRWYMRDDLAQASGAFASGIASARGSMLRHEKLIDFIHRNYAADGTGCWYFQNGPQRVFVELEAAPHVWRVDADGAIESHTGLPGGAVRRCLSDEKGRLYLLTNQHLGIVHPQDMIHAADLIESGHWHVEPVSSQALQDIGAFVASPANRQPARTRGPECASPSAP